MNYREPISKAALHAILMREFARVKPTGCERCEVLMPRRVGENDWTCALAPCEFGCHRDFDFLTRLYCQQYRLRDFTDTIG